MRRRQLTSILLGTLLLAAVAAHAIWAPSAVARGGEDWPFFCSIESPNDDDVNAFKILNDAESPSGYGLQLFAGAKEVAYIFADVSDTADHKFYQVYGRQSHARIFRDRQILAFIAKDTSSVSQGDVQLTWHDADGEFSMRPMNCRAPK